MSREPTVGSGELTVFRELTADSGISCKFDS